jgi:hypothetical protein
MLNSHLLFDCFMRNSTCSCGNNQIRGSHADTKDEPHVLVPVQLLSGMQSQLDRLNKSMYQLSISAIAYDPEADIPRQVEGRHHATFPKESKAVGLSNRKLAQQ